MPLTDVPTGAASSPATPAADTSSSFEDGGSRQLTAILENYLEIIFHLETREGAARASSIAETAGVSRSAVTSALKALQAMGYVDYKPYSLIHLTDMGLSVGRDIAHRHMVFQKFFEQILQLDTETASDAACEIEHVVSADVMRRMGQFVLFLGSREEMWKNWREIYRAEKLDCQHKDQGPEALMAPYPALAARNGGKKKSENDAG